MAQDLKAVISSVLLEIIRRKRPDTPEVTGSQLLVNDLGLASLDLAELLASLEMELGVDPFAQGALISNVKTLDDLLSVYGKVVPSA